MNRPVRVFRPVTSAAARELAPMRGVNTMFPDRKIFQRPLPGVTIISRQASQPKSEFSPYGSIQDVYQPMPETGNASLHLEVIGIEYRLRMGEQALSIMLDDPDGTLEAERLEYLARLGRPAELGRFTPHVTLFNMPKRHADDELLEWARSHQPAKISLQRISAVPHINTSHRPSHESVRYAPIVKSAPLPLPVIRRLGEGAVIPQDLFKKMKPATPAQE